MQSQVKYHENFEKSKGKVTQIADDVEIQRLKNNSKIISNVSYHGELERKQAMEQRRNQLEPGADHYHHNKVSHNNLINNQLNGASHHYAPKVQNGNSTGYLVDSAQAHLNSLSLSNSHQPHHQLNNKQAGNVFANGQQSVYAQQKEAHSAQILHQKLPTKQQEANIYQLQQQHQDYINPQKVAQYVNSSQQLLHQQRQQQQLIGQQPVQYNQFNGNNNHHFVNQQPLQQKHQQQQHQQQLQSNIGYVQQKQQNDWPTSEKQNRLFRAM